jgi:hypothetical protein
MTVVSIRRCYVAVKITRAQIPAGHVLWRLVSMLVLDKWTSILVSIVVSIGEC